jgi:SAM-dependent methyltransferase
LLNYVQVSLAPNKLSEIAHARQALEDGSLLGKPFRGEWGNDYWIKWSTITEAFRRLGIREGTSILDVGCGTGWTTAFLAEAGYHATGIDIAPAMLTAARERAQRWQVDAEFREADMDDFDLGRTFDAALVFDALHHSDVPGRVVDNVARHLRPGGWALFGEPSWLHTISPRARRVHRETGCSEHGVRVSSLKRYCRHAGLGEFRRFFEATRPYERRFSEFLWQWIRLAAANVFVAPQAAVWLAARKPLGPGAD